jgi:quercetin dioxygenase-like cupin family protein
MSPADVVRELAVDPSAWARLVHHDPAERTYALAHRDDEVEVYVVCWMDGHDTGFHDHDDSAAAIAVIRGAVVEERLGLDGTIASCLHAGEVVEVPPEAIHRVRHAGDGPAVTLHAYAPPLRRVGTYAVAPGGALVRHARDAETPLAPEGALIAG